MPVYWLVKSEPSDWSWDDHAAAGVAAWDGVRNAQAVNHLKAMQRGDRGFFYHSGKERSIVGIVEVVRPWYADPDDTKAGAVDLKAIAPVPRPVDLKTVKADASLAHLPLVKQPRLSVMPIDGAGWRRLCELAGVGV